MLVASYDEDFGLVGHYRSASILPIRREKNLIESVADSEHRAQRKDLIRQSKAPTRESFHHAATSASEFGSVVFDTREGDSEMSPAISLED